MSTASGLYTGDGGDGGGSDAPKAAYDAKAPQKADAGGTTPPSHDAGHDAPSGFDVGGGTPPVDAFVGTPDVATNMDTGTTVTPTACSSSTGCSGADPTCCAHFDNGGTPTGMCVESSAACEQSGGASVACNVSGQCTGGNVCCATIDQGGISAVTCSSSCQGNGEYELCDPNAQQNVCAGQGQRCMAYGMTGYGYCVGNMGGQGQH